MIAGIKGRIESIGSTWVIVDVGGVSFQVFLPTSTLSTLGVVGQEVKLHTHLHIREDNMTLYGFGSASELALFQTLITVSGVGPKVGLAMLSAMDVESLTTTIVSGDTSLLTSIPGIGKRTAERIVLELKEKISAGWMITQDVESVQSNSEVLAALTSLGYSVAEATRAVATLSSTQMSIEDKVKMALKYFGGSK